MTQLALTVWLLPRSGENVQRGAARVGAALIRRLPAILWTAISAALTGFNAAFIAN